MTKLVIAVLGLQGGFSKHLTMLKSLGVDVRDVRRPSELAGCAGLIIPGGESTVLMKQIEFIHLKKGLLEFAKNRPVFGTCAGLILMSQQILSSSMEPLGLLDVCVERNAFGRQVDSFSTEIPVKLEVKSAQLLPAIFIRAPRIRSWGVNVEVLASYEEEPVLVRQGHFLGATFHPELTSDSAIHRYFVSICEASSLL